MTHYNNRYARLWDEKRANGNVGRYGDSSRAEVFNNGLGEIFVPRKLYMHGVNPEMRKYRAHDIPGLGFTLFDLKTQEPVGLIKTLNLPTNHTRGCIIHPFHKEQNKEVIKMAKRGLVKKLNN